MSTARRGLGDVLFSLPRNVTFIAVQCACFPPLGPSQSIIPSALTSTRPFPRGSNPPPPTRHRRCWAFSPPGGLASASVGASAKAWCTTVVCGKEWIPRLTAQSFDRLRDEMVLAALRCRLPKLAFGWGVLRRRAWTEADLVLPEVPPHARPVLNEYRKSLARRGELEDSFYDHASSFAAPGAYVCVCGGWTSRG